MRRWNETADAGFALVPERDGSYGASADVGGGKACVNRRESVSRGNFLAAACVYDEMLRLEAGKG